MVGAVQTERNAHRFITQFVHIFECFGIAVNGGSAVQVLQKTDSSIIDYLSVQILGKSGHCRETFSGRRIIDAPDRCVSVRGWERFVKQHQAVGAVEHDIAAMDRPYIGRSCRQSAGEIMIFFIVVQFAHRCSRTNRRTTVWHRRIWRT